VESRSSITRSLSVSSATIVSLAKYFHFTFDFIPK
jgi:hypothetical protein